MVAEGGRPRGAALRCDARAGVAPALPPRHRHFVPRACARRPPLTDMRKAAMDECMYRMLEELAGHRGSRSTLAELQEFLAPDFLYQVRTTLCNRCERLCVPGAQ
eukprot:352544-Chlamydomonas_euryale.AAC.23